MFILHVCCLDDLGNGDNRVRWKRVLARAWVVSLRETIFYRTYKRLSWQFRVAIGILFKYINSAYRNAYHFEIISWYLWIMACNIYIFGCAQCSTTFFSTSFYTVFTLSWNKTTWTDRVDHINTLAYLMHRQEWDYPTFEINLMTLQFTNLWLSITICDHILLNAVLVGTFWSWFHILLRDWLAGQLGTYASLLGWSYKSYLQRWE